MSEKFDKSKIGPNRLVVGAHYGLRDWMAQRATALIMAIYTVILLCKFLTATDFSYEGWAGVFAPHWFRLATLVVFVSLLYHAWVGVRDILMDYIKPVALRMTLQIAAIFWLVGCGFWVAQILWRV